MDEPLFQVSAHKDDYPSPAIGDREQDEELGPIVVVEVDRDGPDHWLLTYEQAGTVSIPELLNRPSGS